MKYSDILLIYLCINLLSAGVNLADKARAKHGKWRIKESTLWLCALCGGAVGGYLTMKAIRHKTQHKSFMIGMPLLSVAQIAVMVYLYFLF